MITRLHSKYPELAQQILSAPGDKRRLAVRTAGNCALRNAGLEGDLLEASLAALDRREPLQPEMRTRLEELQRECDDRYLDVLDSLDARQTLPAEALEAFHRARALAAVLGALEDADGPRATDIVYEAIASSPNESDIVSAISNVAG
jgi:hypothetical protein